MGLTFSTVLRIVDDVAPNLAIRASPESPPSQIALLIRDWLAIHERGLGLTLYYGVGTTIQDIAARFPSSSSSSGVQALILWI